MSQYKQGLTFSQVMPFVKANIKANITPMLLGIPGIGKSSLVADLGRVFKTEVFSVSCNQLADRADLTGIRMTEDDQKNPRMSFFPHENIQRAIRYAKDHKDETPILFLDEINRAPVDVTTSLLSFITERRIGTETFPENIRFVTAGNDKGNVTSLDKASITRFVLYHVKPDLETFLNVNPTLNAYIKSTLMKNEDLLVASNLVEEDTDDDGNATFDLSSDMDGEDSFDQNTVPRTLAYLSQTLNELGIDNTGTTKEEDALKEFISQSSFNDDVPVLKTIIAAHIGETEMTEALFETIMEAFNKMISNGGNGSANPNGIDLSKVTPTQTNINVLSKSTSLTDIEAFVPSLDADEKQHMLIWLLTNKAMKEVNNKRACEDAIAVISNDVQNFGQTAFRVCIDICSKGELNTDMANAFEATNSDAYREIGQIISSYT